jgi:hypothetical protein
MAFSVKDNKLVINIKKIGLNFDHERNIFNGLVVTSVGRDDKVWFEKPFDKLKEVYPEKKYKEFVNGKITYRTWKPVRPLIHIKEVLDTKDKFFTYVTPTERHVCCAKIEQMQWFPNGFCKYNEDYFRLKNEICSMCSSITKDNWWVHHENSYMKCDVLCDTCHTAHIKYLDVCSTKHMYCKYLYLNYTDCEELAHISGKIFIDLAKLEVILK